ncbi:E3 ubiquitin-protein ligase RNF25 isoform X1 [Amborella trichopoda]|uniref:RWD domain-containing protein n=1 Tax=Amborella trichopoda TaxID=13333 RepID=W1NYA0_AMBTC|nr:E3 ubiquitin-protein ligase RNF25 isoform X1 [Amborella trichopoda]ERN00251.1 hypothetical protein AMTR_s00111p00136950 [Amborella trichopoda]|eukprot:XP_006837397.3 E3 ubiquitin-protein ligase RNF25 isoform X1 [Amborella trichopoda]
MEGELRAEIEAVQSVYGPDCLMVQELPTCITVHIRPRTADDLSQQFVEAILCIRVSGQYPYEPPTIDVIDSKGLDENRRAHLIATVQEQANELASYPMLVMVCEEAVETLSNMNHPDGNCPLCLYPLVTEVREEHCVPFMKLMSCYHCFHRQCIIRWWKWLQEEDRTRILSSDFSQTSSSLSIDLEGEGNASGERSEPLAAETHNVGNCPVCRKVIHAKDIEHVLDLLRPGSSQLPPDETNVVEEEVLLSDIETIKREKFEATVRVQRENGGLIEPKKIDVLQPGIFLPETTNLNSSRTGLSDQKVEASNFLTRSGDDSNTPGSSMAGGSVENVNSSQRRKGRDQKARVSGDKPDGPGANVDGGFMENVNSSERRKNRAQIVALTRDELNGDS